MPSVFLIGTPLASHKPQFVSKGHTVRFFRSTAALINNIGKADIVIIDACHRDIITELKKNSRHIPKIIIESTNTTGKKISWAREPLAYTICDPSPADLTALTSRALKESASINKTEQTTRDLTTLKAELSFFEDISRVMTTSTGINDILPAIMKQAKKITGAESWAIYLADPDTDELSCNRTSGRLSKACANTLAALAAWNIKNKKPLLIENIASSAQFSSKSTISCKNRNVSIIGTPIETEGSSMGALELLKIKKSFTVEDMEFLFKLASRAAIALERINLQHRLEELVITDDLTNLFNTRYLNRSIENEVLRSRRYGLSVSVIFMDVDYFKNVNDNHGHLAGSKLLVEMGEILIAELRNIDIVARYGGDEFVIVLPQTNLNSAMAIAERIRESIEKNIFLQTEGLSLQLTSSFGVAAYPETASSKEDLMRLADESMYRVKKHTRNGVYAIIH